MTSTYVVTGASRGLGLEFVRQLASQGHFVIALARNPEGSKGLQTLVDENKKVFAIQLDVLNPDSIKVAVDAVSNASPDGIDFLINNAGISSEQSYNVLNSPGEEYLKVFNTNVVAVSNVTHAFLPLLRKRGENATKKILNISSILSSVALIGEINPSSKGSAYSVSKSGLNMLTKLFANSLAKENFIVYAAHPGWVKTDMGGENAPVEPKDSIAGLLNVLQNIKPEQNGSLIDFQGKTLPW